MDTDRRPAAERGLHWLPQTKEEWGACAFFPFKAYPIIAFICYQITQSMPRPRHEGITDAELVMVAFTAPCGPILIVAAIILAFTRYREAAIANAIFGFLALLIAWLLLPALAHA